MSHIQKYGGRIKGTPNKATAIQREYIQTLLDGQKAKIEAELSTLKGKEYLSVILALMDFTMPKLSRVELTEDFNQSGVTRIVIE